MDRKRIGIIGGTGLYEMEGLENIHKEKVETPYGAPSEAYIVGKISGKEVVFLPRHGIGHKIPPSELNFRANIYGFKKLGCQWLIGVNSVGSLREEMKPLDIVLPDQFFDRSSRKCTFFEKGLVAHISFAEPTCKTLRDIIMQAGSGKEVKVHNGGTYINMEGPAFSTRAESNVYRQLGFDVIGMTALSEAKLAREAEICYAAMALVTDYDCWRVGEEPVTTEVIIGNLKKNINAAKEIIKSTVRQIPEERDCPCACALSNAIVTSPDEVSPDVLRKLKIIVGKYI